MSCLCFRLSASGQEHFVPTVTQAQQLCGDATPMGSLCATPADSTLNCTMWVSPLDKTHISENKRIHKLLHHIVSKIKAISPRCWLLSCPRSTGPSPWRRTAFKRATEKCPTRTRRARRRPCSSRTRMWFSRPLWTALLGLFHWVLGLSSPTVTHRTSSQHHHPCIPPPPYPTHTTSTPAWCQHWCEITQQAPESRVQLGASSLACQLLVWICKYVFLHKMSCDWGFFCIFSTVFYGDVIFSAVNTKTYLIWQPYLNASSILHYLNFILHRSVLYAQNDYTETLEINKMCDRVCWRLCFWCHLNIVHSFSSVNWPQCSLLSGSIVLPCSGTLVSL